MKQPLVPLAVLYSAGLILGHYVEIPILAAFLICFIFVAAAWRDTPARLWLLAATVFLLGWLNLTLHTATISPHDIRRLMATDSSGELAAFGPDPADMTVATVRARLLETPAQRVFVRDDQESWRTLAEVEIDSIQFHRDRGAWRPACGRVLAITAGVLTNSFVQGQAVEVEGVLMLPPPPIAEGLFDYRRYLYGRGLAYELKVESPEQWKLRGAVVAAPFTAKFRDWAQRIMARGLPEQDEALRLQWAMVLGWQTALTNEVAEPFMKSGTMHIFAISGLHIALIAGVFVALFRALTIPRIVSGAVIIPLIWFYTAATGWQPSAIRSTVMMTVVIGGWALRRPSNLLNSLAAAALVILVWDPLQLYQAGFQLSFFVVLSIALLVPLLDSVKQRLFKPDPLLPRELRPAWQRWGFGAANWGWTFVSTSLAAFLGSLPLIAYYFHLFTPGSLLANLAVVPVSSFALMSGIGAIVTGDLFPFLTEAFNHSGWFFMRAMVWLSQGATELPGSWIYVRAPDAIEFFAYYGLLTAMLLGLFRRPWLRWISAGVLGGLTLISLAQWVGNRRCAEIHVLPLTGTHAVLAREAGSSDSWLVNCGSHAAFGLVLKPFLQANGINRIAHLVLARADMPHAGAMADVHLYFPVGNATVAPQRSSSRPFRDLVADMEAEVTLLRNATNGADIGPWQVLHPDARDSFRRGHDMAVSLLGNLGGARVLILPDLGPAGQAALYNRAPDLRADIVVAGLPDAGEPLPNAWLERLGPQLVVIADCQLPAVRRASPALRERLRRFGVPVLFTRDTGALTLQIKDGRWRVRTACAVN